MIDSIISPPTLTQPPVNFKQLIDQNRYPDPGLSADQQLSFSHHYSLAALILQFVYYFAMGDQLLAWLSLGCSVSIVLTPLLLIMPIWARRRAYSSRSWSSFSEFYAVQQKWDRSALYLTVATVIISLIFLWFFGPIILSSVHALTGNTDTGASFTQQLQDATKQYQAVLGQ